MPYTNGYIAALGLETDHGEKITSHRTWIDTQTHLTSVKKTPPKMY
jgi:hypothetical protein